MVDIVFETRNSTDLHMWTSRTHFNGPHPSLNMHANNLVGLHNTQSFSPRFQQLVIHAIGLIGYQDFKQAEEEILRLLNNL